MHKLLALFSLFTVTTLSAQIEEVRRITEQLCAPEFHGRGYVNKGDSLAAEFLAFEFEKLEVEPYGKSYFQHFDLSVNTFPDKMEVVQGNTALRPGRDYVIAPEAEGGKVELIYKVIPSSKVLDIEFLKSTIVEIQSGTHYNSVLFDLTELAGDTLKNVQGLSAELAAIVPVIELVDKKFTWSVSQKQRTKLFLKIQKSAINIQEPLEVDIESKYIPDYQSQNVIAYIPAKKKCAETIVFTAHYDHLGRMGREAYFPGANDNASGTAMLFTMAKHFKTHPSDYNVMFIAFGGEEAGLLGSKYFVDHPVLKLKKIAFVLNLDIMGSGEEGITVVNATVFEEQFKILQQINDEKKLLAQVKKRGPAANSDHYWFTEKGVPAFFIYTMGFNKHYHDVFDEYSELSFVEYQDITTLLIEFVKQLKK